MKFVAAVFSTLLTIYIIPEAAATPIRYSFSGALTDIRNNGAGITFGTAFLGSYIHDDSPQIGYLIEPGRELYSGSQFGLSTATTTLLGGLTTELQVFNDWTSVVGGYNHDDGYFVSSRIYDNQVGFYLIQFDLWDFSGATLTSLAMPSQTQFTQLAMNGRAWIRHFEGGIETGLAGGTFVSMASQAIPEPNTLALLLASIVSLGWFRCRRESAS